MSENDDFTTRVIRRKTPSTPPALEADATQLGGRIVTPPPLPVDDDRTRVHRGSAGETQEAAVSESGPTVGWLVIMEGPGRGQSLTLGFGMNHIGRSATNRLVLDFGDEEISRKTHTTLTYDPRGKKFYIQPGPDATNLTYLGEEGATQPVLTPTEITGGETISLGRTRLMFVAFCGPHFSWE
jgi:hypothetical protein